jgi:hypothetical protein
LSSNSVALVTDRLPGCIVFYEPASRSAVPDEAKRRRVVAGPGDDPGCRSL